MGAAYKDFLGGQVKFMFPDLASALPHIFAPGLAQQRVRKQ